MTLFWQLRMELIVDRQRRQTCGNRQPLAVYPEVRLNRKQTGPFLGGSREGSALGQSVRLCRGWSREDCVAQYIKPEL